MRKFSHIISVIILTLIACSCGSQIGEPETVRLARKFCVAVYNNDMVTAKSYMTQENASRTPDKMYFPRNEGAEYLERLNNSDYKIIEGDESSVVTVRFYDPQYEYLSDEGRWFCCSVLLAKYGDEWRVVDYGY